MKETRMAKAWKTAAQDLGIEFISPFQFQGRDGRQYTCSGLLPQFGGPKGTLIQSGLEDTDLDAADAAAELLGFYTTGLSPSYEEYERSLAIDALRTWAWSGPTETRPIWYLDSKVCDVDNPCEACQHRDHIIDPSICSKEKPCVACKFYNG